MRALSFPVLMLFLAAAGCAPIRVASEPSFPEDWSPPATWSWAEDTARAPDSLDEEFQDAVVRELDALGWRQVEPAAAQVLVRLSTDVDRALRNADPFFALYAVEEIEKGTVTIDLQCPRSGDRLWWGSATSELRVSRTPIGPFAVTLQPTDAPRRWRVDEKVTRILRQLPSYAG